MTNYEWMVKNNKELVKYILSRHVSKEKGIPNICSRTGCNNCDFGGYPCTISSCTDATEKWLDEEHEPLYKKGDIVVDRDGQLAVVKEYECDEGVITISHFVDNVTGIKRRITEIKKKVGHIESEENNA